MELEEIALCALEPLESEFDLVKRLEFRLGERGPRFCLGPVLVGSHTGTYVSK